MPKYLAIDDEPVALSIIENFCSRLDNKIELALYDNPNQGINYLKNNQVDIIFLDIDINGVSGLDLAKLVPPSTALIFTTAHSDYAIHGFELCATDFLHKPFSFDRFKVAIDKAQNTTITTRIPAIEKEIILKVEYKNVSIKLSDIEYIEAMDNYIKVHRVNQRAVISQMPMKSIMELLPQSDFVRIHRSYIANRSAIESFTKRILTLKSGTSLTVGRIYAKEL